MTAKRFITDDKGNKLAAIVPIKEYEKLLNKLDDLNDVITYDIAMRRKKKLIPLEEALVQLEQSRTSTTQR